MKIIKNYESYNSRRFSKPWVAEVKEDGSFDFKKKIGIYDGTDLGGALVIFEPEEGKVYGYGQTDNRGNKTEISFVKFVNGAFVECTRLGRLKDEGQSNH